MAYTEEQKQSILNTVCERIINGEAVRNILKDDDMPDVTTFYVWIDSDEEKSKQYARATELRAEKIFDEILTIADSTSEDVIIDENGLPITNHNVINRDRLRVDARKWAVSKLAPKKYGDHSKLTLEGGDKPIQISFED